MSTLIPKHLRKSPVNRFSLNERKQIYNVPKTGVKSVDDRAENRTKLKTPYLVYKQKRTQVGAASPEVLKEALKARLRKLKEAGYYTGKIDGIWGKKSKAALAAYDRDNGKTGETTFQTVERSIQNAKNILPYKESVKVYLASLVPNLTNFFKSLGLSDEKAQTAVLKIPKNPIDRNGELTSQCAAYVNRVLMDNGVFSKGHAPKVLELFKTIYKGYNDVDIPDMSNYSHKDSVKTIVDLHHQAADNFAEKIDTTKLDRNHMYPVNMYYGKNANRASSHTTDFYEMGIKNDTPGSHVGLVYSDPKKGWRVTHNISGNIHDDALSSVLGSKRLYGIIGMADAGEIKDKPQYEQYSWYDPRGWFKNGGILKARYGVELPEVLVTAISPNVVTSESGKRFIRGLNNSRSTLMLKYNLSDLEYADLSKFALNVASRESKVGNSASYNFKSIFPDWIIKVGKMAKFRKPGARSLGYSQIKYKDDVKDPELKKLYDDNGITEKSISTSPQAMAKATVLRTMYNDLKLFPNNNTYYYSDNTPIPKDTARAMYWNRGKLTSGLNEPTSNPNANGATAYARRFENESLIH